MKTIGLMLKEARIKKKLSLKKLEEITKIKKSFINAIEDSNWEKLPEYTVVVGFVKNISGFLGFKEKEATAILRRDYPPDKRIRVNPKRDISREFFWSPKLTFIVGGLVIFLVIMGYLVSQYIHFIKPPDLTVYQPLEGQIVKVSKIEVIGKTEASALIKVNNQPALVEDNGNFKTEINLLSGDNKIEIDAISRSQKVTTIIRNIKVE